MGDNGPVDGTPKCVLCVANLTDKNGTPVLARHQWQDEGSFGRSNGTSSWLIGYADDGGVVYHELRALNGEICTTTGTTDDLFKKWVWWCSPTSIKPDVKSW